MYGLALLIQGLQYWRCGCGELNPNARKDCGNCGATKEFPFDPIFQKDKYDERDKYNKFARYVKILGIINKSIPIETYGTIKMELPDPITNFTGEHNVKPRLVYCKECHYEIMTDKAGPKCGICHSYLIVCPKV